MKFTKYLFMITRMILLVTNVTKKKYLKTYDVKIYLKRMIKLQSHFFRCFVYYKDKKMFKSNDTIQDNISDIIKTKVRNNKKYIHYAD